LKNLADLPEFGKAIVTVKWAVVNRTQNPAGGWGLLLFFPLRATFAQPLEPVPNRCFVQAAEPLVRLWFLRAVHNREF
jgi:hypothetical protein